MLFSDYITHSTRAPSVEYSQPPGVLWTLTYEQRGHKWVLTWDDESILFTSEYSSIAMAIPVVFLESV